MGAAVDVQGGRRGGCEQVGEGVGAEGARERGEGSGALRVALREEDGEGRGGDSFDDSFDAAVCSYELTTINGER